MYIVSHGDLDGCGCAILLRQALDSTECGEQDTANVSVEFCDYDDIDEKIIKFLDEEADNFIEHEDRLFITDICPSKETCNKLDEFYHRGLAVRLMDHHKTRSWVSKYAWSHFDDSVSATKIVEDWLINIHQSPENKKRSDFCAAVDAWDMWRIGNVNRHRGESLNALMHFIGLESFHLEFSKDMSSDSAPAFSALIGYLHKNRQRKVKRIIESQLHQTEYHMGGNGDTFKILFAEEFVSDVAHAALEDSDSQDLQYVVVVSPCNNSCGLRSRQEQDVDVSIIAKKLGGGGHAKASGFKTSITQRLEEKIANMLNQIE